MKCNIVRNLQYGVENQKYFLSMSGINNLIYLVQAFPVRGILMQPAEMVLTLGKMSGDSLRQFTQTHIL